MTSRNSWITTMFSMEWSLLRHHPGIVKPSDFYANRKIHLCRCGGFYDKAMSLGNSIRRLNPAGGLRSTILISRAASTAEVAGIFRGLWLAMRLRFERTAFASG